MEQDELPNENKSFSAWDYAEEAFSETLSYMTDEELNEIDSFDNKDELREYLQQFFERT